MKHRHTLTVSESQTMKRHAPLLLATLLLGISACDKPAEPAQAKAERPLFLYFALNSPHTPIVPSAAWKDKSGLGDYADFVMQTDDAIGQVLTAIDAAGLAEVRAATGLRMSDALVLYTAERHGAELATTDRSVARAAEQRGITAHLLQP